MFQTFAAQTSPEQGPPRLMALRAQMQTAGVDAFIVPRADAHQGEYVAPRDARLAWLTGFSGSAGFCVVLPDIAGVFVDGRYRVQVRAEVADVFTPVHWPETQLADWVLTHLPKGAVIGFDPWLHSAQEIASLTKKLSAYDLRATDNLVDAIWHDQPSAPSTPFLVQPIEFAGEPHTEKRIRIADTLTADTAVITLPDSIAWLLNIRGTDIARNPVPQGFAILHAAGKVDLFAGPGKADGIREHLGSDVQLHDVSAFLDSVAQLSGSVQIDPKSCPDIVVQTLIRAGASVQHCADPCLLPKAIKNSTEIAGAKAAHHRDGIAMVRFLAWLDAEAPKGALTEIDVVTALEGFRAQTNALRDISFETISGAGPNAAIVHYRVNENTNRTVNPGELLLVDSGGQYVDGTTDITRTIAVGIPTEDHRKCYTRVLQGMIAISCIRFPKGVGGQHLDALARAPLWLAGQDYDHGTGHGVGSYLSVHEGPQGISRRSEVALEAGMILSNEPGYYREGAFGIRIENLITVITAPALPGADARDMLGFDTLTYVPLDRRLIDKSLLTDAERDWIDQYHADTVALLASHLDATTCAWLKAACAPL
ncbi:aminopeptidase P family protein [Loktanella sp. D2R18]|uniref:aminopeptidase P family protein n=1 Tax=Rhodobacterales TaxID=204455 RepID=UPI000DEBEBBA|nr:MULTISPECIES: aminopeptidase P family protein [Rhodobacterales]MDO6589078.1 aminopeptidase P family protein [Yoonia sp. 1_MG-2023]RBW45485.1 aminopeptidase P family protein [Loktanella sp. D2R18]